MAKGKKSEAKTIEITERQEKALSFRRSGLSIREIATRLETSPATVHADIKTMLAEAVKENVDNAEQLRALEVDRLDRIALGLSTLVFPRSDRNGATIPPDLKAVDRYLRLSEQRSKLLGLYAPITQDHSGAISVRLVREIGFNPQPTISETDE